MGRFVGIWILLCAACGRIGFDPSGDGGAGDGRRADGAGPDGGFIPGGITYVKASNTDGADAFGAAVALSADGSTLVVGAYGEASAATGIDGNEADNSSALAGAAYVYVRAGGVWTQQAYIKASNSETGDLFATSIALSDDGNTLAVGAIFEDSSTVGINTISNENGINSGAVYVFRRSVATWSQEAYIKASDTQAGDGFGQSVALSGDGTVLAVGSHLDDGGVAPDTGSAYVFVRTTMWAQVAKLLASNPGIGDSFGESIALAGDGTTLAVGAYFESSAATGINGNELDDSEGASGAVYVFAGGPASWSQQAYVKATNTFGGDQFGVNVGLSRDGNVLAVGAHIEDSSAAGVGGDPFNDALPASGAAYVLVRAGTTWSHETYFKATNPDQDDNFGLRIAISADGGTLIAGAINESSAATGVNGNQSDNSLSHAGAAYVYGRSGPTWVLSAYLKATSPGVNDNMCTPAISGDGGTIAVGAFQEASAARGINGDDTDDTAPGAGAVYVYD